MMSFVIITTTTRSTNIINHIPTTNFTVVTESTKLRHALQS